MAFVEKIKDGAWLIVGLIFVLPIILIDRMDQRYRAAKKSKKPRKSTLAELRTPRKRALTLPLPLYKYEKRKINLQKQSLFFKMLPPELRYLIFKECSGGMKFHVNICNGRLCSIVCALPDSNDSFIHTRCPPPGGIPGEELQNPRKLLAPLLTCR